MTILIMNSAAAAAFEPLSNSLCGFYKGFQQLLSWTEALRGKGVRSGGPSQPHVVPNAPREPLLEIKTKTIIILRTKLALIIDKAKFQNSKLTLRIAHDRYPWLIKPSKDLFCTLFGIRILLIFWKGYVCLYSSKLYFVQTKK